MRSAVAVIVIGVACALAPSASADVFPDLPGLDAAERLTGSTAPAATQSDATVSNATRPGRVPTPDSSDVVAESTTPSDKLIIRKLPGGSGIPLFEDDARAASTSRGTLFGLIALAVLVVVLWTRFLVRLNALGRTA